MAMMEEWIIQAKLSGDFNIINERRSVGAPPIQGLHKFELTPERDNDGKWTGLHELQATLLIENKENIKLESHVIFEHAKRLVNSIIALASLGTGRPIRLSGGISAKLRLKEEPPKYRFVTGALQAASIAPPIALPVKLLAVSINPILERAIRWWSRGIATNDAVDRLVALNNSLDLIAGTFDDVPSRTRKCRSCGIEEVIGPGLRERVAYFLTSQQGYTEAQAKAVYECRLDLAHARSSLDEADLRRYREYARLVEVAVRNGIADRLGITLPPLPEALPFDAHSGVLDIEYISPAHKPD